MAYSEFYDIPTLELSWCFTIPLLTAIQQQHIFHSYPLICNFQATMLLEYFCLFVFILRLFHVWCFAAGVKFWRDKKNIIFLAIIVVR